MLTSADGTHPSDDGATALAEAALMAERCVKKGPRRIQMNLLRDLTADQLVGALVDKELRLVKLDRAGRPLGQERLLGRLGERIRDVRVAPDGAIWLTTDDAAGKLLRVTRGQAGG